MPHILFVIDTLETGGTELSLLQLSKGLIERDWKVGVCSLYRGNSLSERFREIGATVFPLNIDGKFRFLHAVRRVRRLAKTDFRPDIIHTMLFRADQIGRIVGKSLGVPVISSFTGMRYAKNRFVLDECRSRYRVALRRLCDLSTAHFVNAFHAVSECVKQHNCLSLHVRAARVEVIPRSRVDTSLQLSSEQKHALKNELHIVGRSPILLNVGRLDSAKGQQHAISAMQHIIARFPNAILLIAGDGQLRKPLLKQRDNQRLNDYVLLLGQRDDVPRLLALADVFVFPSVYEGLPGAMLEAMLASVPIVASNISVHREIIHDGISGVLSSVDPYELASKTIAVLDNPDDARRMGATARNDALERFSTHQVLSRMVQLYDRTMQHLQSAHD